MYSRQIIERNERERIIEVVVPTSCQPYKNKGEKTRKTIRKISASLNRIIADFSRKTGAIE
jgi:hypothetical protein